MFYVLTLIPVVMLSVAIVRYWRSLYRFGYTKEVIGLAPNMFALDGVALLSAAMTFYWCLHSWFGFTLPWLQQRVLADWQVTFMAVVCSIATCAIAYFNAGQRFMHPTVAGMQEAALRTMAALRIIDAIELAQWVERARAHHGTVAHHGRVIDADEVQK